MRKLSLFILLISLSFGDIQPTQERYGAYEDFETICKNEFGEKARVAQWEEIKKLFEKSEDKESLIKELKFTKYDQTYILKHKTDYFEEGDRHFIITYHNHKLPTHYTYLVHDTIDGHLLGL